MQEEARKKIVTTNVQQAEFYNKANDSRITNIPMRLWRFVRRRMYWLMNESQIRTDIFGLHKEWIGDLTGKKVLDFGCYEGNTLSHYLASHSGDYLGIDLSDQALSRLQNSFKKNGIDGARVRAVDVLSDDFEETGFDVIYAQGVLHHFNPIDALLPVLYEKLNPEGMIVSLDPLQTSVLTKTVRGFYHPFRSDKDWEWPFQRSTFDKIKEYFEIEHMQGFLGRSKWAIPFVFINKGMARYLVNRWHRRDLQLANAENRQLWACLQLAMCLRKVAPLRMHPK